MAIQTDSGEYEILKSAAKLSAGVPGLSCEIGLRRGGGSAFMMQGLVETAQWDRVHIAIDPYGNIEYESHEGAKVRLDYTNTMYYECMVDMFGYAKHLNIHFLFFPLEDNEFFSRYADGVPVYRDNKQLINEYAVVHFDGPHAHNPLVTEFEFFNDRTRVGAMFVFDDIGFYNHTVFEEEYIFPNGWELVTKGNIKASYVKVKN